MHERERAAQVCVSESAAVESDHASEMRGHRSVLVLERWAIQSPAPFLCSPQYVYPSVPFTSSLTVTFRHRKLRRKPVLLQKFTPNFICKWHERTQSEIPPMLSYSTS